MGVTPGPIVVLLFPAGLLVFVLMLVILGKVQIPRSILAVVPAVIVLVSAIIDSNLHARLGLRYGYHDNRSRKGGGQAEITDPAASSTHIESSNCAIC